MTWKQDLKRIYPGKRKNWYKFSKTSYRYQKRYDKMVKSVARRRAIRRTRSGAMRKF